MLKLQGDLLHGVDRTQRVLCVLHATGNVLPCGVRKQQLQQLRLVQLYVSMAEQFAPAQEKRQLDHLQGADGARSVS